MSESWIVIGAGSAGCVVANRLSANPSRHVTLLETGPPLEAGAVPAGIEGASFFAAMGEAGRMFPDVIATRTEGTEPTPYQRGRGVGGSSAINAMVALRGNPDLYARWGWDDADHAWSQVAVPTEAAASHELGAVDRALLHDDRAAPLQLTRRNGRRVTAAEAYLWPVMGRPNLAVKANSAVHRVSLADRRAVGVTLDDGTALDADRVVVCAGAIHSPVVLLRSGVDTLGVGTGLQDHPSVVFTLALRPGVAHDGFALPLACALHARIADNLIQLLPMSNVGPDSQASGLGALMAALMTPAGRAGTVTIDSGGQPVIDFALLQDPRDVRGLIDAAELGLEVLSSPAFERIVEQAYIDDAGTTTASLRDPAAIEAWVRSNCGDYVHATSTCAMGTVVDDDFALRGYDGLYVCDASVFPTIPDANTHLPTTMLAERFGLRHG